MTDLERDPIVGRAIEELRQLPPVDSDAVRRVVAAAAAARLAASDESEAAASGRRTAGWWGLAAIAAAAAFAGFMLRGAWPSGRAEPPATLVNPSGNAPIRTASAPTNDALPVPRQFVFRNGAARKVAVVGDFNEWDPAAAPMTRSPDGLWSVTLPVIPGRHVYGFMVNDSLFRLDPDPRVPRARDTDFGVDGSVVIVGRP